MDTTYKPAEVESRIYTSWENSGLLSPPKRAKNFTVLMPPPNANASLHAGHGMFVVDDIIIRYKRLRGFASLWVPGTDHAGFETQFVYEKHLAKQGKSRMDFDRETLYNDIFKFVKDNSGLIYSQFKKLGFLADWNRSVFTLDKHVIKRVFETFKKMEGEGYVYRDEYMVNYCTHCGTSLAELEVNHVERVDPLYYIKYGPFVLATVRPETKFGDTALAVHPKDTRYKKWIGQEVEAEGLLGHFQIKVIGDEMVDPEFGTGVVKVTPAHDPNDFQMGKKHNLEFKKVIDLNGRLTEIAGPYAGMKVKEARKLVGEDLKKKGLMEKIDETYMHSVTVCYKCGRDLEPTIVPNWFIKVADLKKPVIAAIKKGAVKFYPARFKKQTLDWMEMMHDWPISRQIAWGIRIPVWYEVDKSASNIWVNWLDKEKKLRQGNVREFLEKGITLDEIEKGLQKVHALTGPSGPAYKVSDEKPGPYYLPETDTFDTWFSSGQWPLVTLREDEYETRYPTDFMGTMTDILKIWVSRMVMFSLYLKKEVPFKNVYLWSMVTDAKGQKMSKSKGNVINPVPLVNTYGADAFRAALVFGTSQGGKIPLSEDKVRAMRNFANKVWNIGRFLKMADTSQTASKEVPDAVKKLKEEFLKGKSSYKKAMDGYHFSRAFNELYEFMWHRLADIYIEELKESLKGGNIEVRHILEDVYLQTVQMLHPFMPFVTESIWQEFKGKEKSILNSEF